MQDDSRKQFEPEQTPDSPKKIQPNNAFGEMGQSGAEEAPPDIIIEN
jgi:hypothetical protein